MQKLKSETKCQRFEYSYNKICWIISDDLFNNPYSIVKRLK